MSLKKLITIAPLKLRFQNTNIRFYCSKSDKILKSAEETPLFIEEEVDTSELEQKRNKSKLSVEHRNILFGRNPYNEPMAWYHNTVKYKKRMLGRYGMEAVGVPAGFAWPTPKEVEEQKEYENIAHPPNIQERLQKIKKKKEMKEKELIERQKKINEKMTNMSKLIAEVQQKIAIKEAKALQAKKLKEEKIEKVRQQLITEGVVTEDKITKELAKAAKIEKKKKKELKAAQMIQWQQKMLQQMAKEQDEDNDDDDDKDKK